LRRFFIVAGNPRLSSALIIAFSAVIIGGNPWFDVPVISVEDLVLRVVDDVAESFHEGRLVRTQGTQFLLYREPVIDDISVRHPVILAFEPENAFVLALNQGPSGDEIVITDDLGPDEPPLHVGVDGAGLSARKSFEQFRLP
jgi:hypothetical protein